MSTKTANTTVSAPSRTTSRRGQRSRSGSAHVTTWVVVGSAVMLALAWLGIAGADGPTTYGDVPTAAIANSDATTDRLVTPVSRPASTPVRQSRAS